MILGSCTILARPEIVSPQATNKNDEERENASDNLHAKDRVADAASVAFGTSESSGPGGRTLQRAAGATRRSRGDRLMCIYICIERERRFSSASLYHECLHREFVVEPSCRFEKGRSKVATNNLAEPQVVDSRLGLVKW